jgi:hypothetical protein
MTIIKLKFFLVAMLCIELMYFGIVVFFIRVSLCLNLSYFDSWAKHINCAISIR